MPRICRRDFAAKCDTLSTMVRAILFDCFGVLAEDGWSPFKKQYIDNPRKSAEISALGKAVDEGRRTYEDMIRGTAHVAHVGESVVRAAVERRVPNERLLEYIRSELRQSYKIGMLSNASYDVTQLLFTPDQMALFDTVVLSYDVGLTKPDPAMYILAADRLGVAAAECIMVDDKASHCAGAIAVGMQAVEYENMSQFTHEVQDMLAAAGQAA